MYLISLQIVTKVIILLIVFVSLYSVYYVLKFKQVESKKVQNNSDLGMSRLRFFMVFLIQCVIFTLYKTVKTDNYSIGQLFNPNYLLTVMPDFWVDLIGGYMAGAFSIITNLYNSKNFTDVLFWILIYLPASLRLQNADKSNWWLLCPIYPILLFFLPTRRQIETKNEIENKENEKLYNNHRMPLNYKKEFTEIKDILESKYKIYCSKYINDRNIEISLIVWSFIQIFFYSLGFNTPVEEIVKTDNYYGHTTKSTSFESQKSTFWTIFDGFDNIRIYYDLSELVFYVGVPVVFWIVYKRYLKK